MQNKSAVDNQLRKIYKLCGICAFAAVCFGLFDMIFGNISSGNLIALPQSAVERFDEFRHSWFMGLYHLDLLNVIISFLLLVVFFGLFAVHRDECYPYASIALIISVVGTVIFVANNVALPMYGLSIKYNQATQEIQKMYYASAGEALLARGEHSGYGAFMGFFLSTLSSLSLSFVMLKGRLFSKASSYLGIVGHMFMLIYVVLVTFAPSVKSLAAIVATPGGIMALVWLIIVGIRFIQMGKRELRGFQEFNNIMAS